MRQARVAVVTGATSGIGRFIARGVARGGFTTVVVGRDRTRLRALAEWLSIEAPSARIEIEEADLSLIADARRAGAILTRRHERIAILVNNAGIFATAREETAEGIERVIATNHLVPFVLTRALAAPLRADGAARIVNVGSVMGERVRLNPADLQLTRRWRPVRAYGQSKRALALATFGWAEQLAPEVTVNVVHPGAVATEIVRTRGIARFTWQTLTPFLLTPARGAKAPLAAALDPARAGVTGRYYRGLREAPRAKLGGDDEALRRALWQATEELVDR